MRIYEHFGISITRTSRSQAVAGREIALSDVQVGDLVFYTNIQTGEIGHVAMYIGNGQIVHAASETLGIIVSSMYYRQPCKAVTFLN
jgi:cell wall-associated NlpC family hydrolase